MLRSSTASLLSTSTRARLSSGFPSSFSSCAILFNRWWILFLRLRLQPFEVTLNEFVTRQQSALDPFCIIDAGQDIVVLFADQFLGMFHPGYIRIDDDQLAQRAASIKYRSKS